VHGGYPETQRSKKLFCSLPNQEMAEIDNRLRLHRQGACLSQRELGLLLGYGSEGQVPLHEKSRTLPTLLMALSYQIIFQEPVSDMFAGLYECVVQAVEGRLTELEESLRQSKAKGARAAAAKRTLEWLEKRRAQSNPPNEPKPSTENPGA
jgi:DNA-binding XRE family transcriptional regulator